MTNKFDLVGVLLVLYKEGGEDANALWKWLLSKVRGDLNKITNTV